MEKFKKLNRNEMRNVTGGNLHTCTLGCQVQIGYPNPTNPGGTYFTAVTSVPDCTESSQAVCVDGGGKVLYCTCGVI